MQLLQEFFRSENLNLNGKTITREAVRGIILHGTHVLMMYSTVNKDYKFPGGGIEKLESYAETLQREIKEECGVLMSEISSSFGFMVEYDKPQEDEYDVFKQISYYYRCKIDHRYVGQDLDDYEQQLGFRPEWVGIEVAIKQNVSILSGDFGEPPRWTKRDTYVLSRVAASLGVVLL